MHVTHHAIEIHAEASRVFAIIGDVERWPERFPPCLRVEMIERTERTQTFEITALADGAPRTWRSHRELFPEAHAITFRSLQPLALLASMEGRWRVIETRSSIVLSLEHSFTLANPLPAGFAGVASEAEALAFMQRTLDQNSSAELAAIKTVAEQPFESDPLATTFSESLVIDGTAQEAYALLRDATVWPGLLPHCHAIDMRYDDGTNQEFEMRVQVANGHELIRSIRHCSGLTIRYFQPEPPPVLARHTGAWHVTPLGRDRCRVQSTHTVKLDPIGVLAVWGQIAPADALARVERAINANSVGTMQAIARRLSPTAEVRHAS